MKDKLLVNFDCVGDGTEAVFIVMKGAEERNEFKLFSDCFEAKLGYTPRFYPMRGSESNSDYKNFPCGIGCMMCRKAKNGLMYTPRIHTKRDTVSNDDNIEYLADGMIKFAEKLSMEG